MYREMWERLKEEIDMALDEGRECGYDDPKSANYDKFVLYNHIRSKLMRIENGVTDRRREGRRPMRLIDDRETVSNRIKTVIFNDPATVVIWKDGTKTVVKCQPGDTYSKETGLALCIAKKFLGNKGNFNDVFKKWIPEDEPNEEVARIVSAVSETTSDLVKMFHSIFEK